MSDTRIRTTCFCHSAFPRPLSPPEPTVHSVPRISAMSNAETRKASGPLHPFRRRSLYSIYSRRACWRKSVSTSYVSAKPTSQAGLATIPFGGCASNVFVNRSALRGQRVGERRAIGRPKALSRLTARRRAVGGERGNRLPQGALGSRFGREPGGQRKAPATCL